jgi:hypothetical protein
MHYIPNWQRAKVAGKIIKNEIIKANLKLARSQGFLSIKKNRIKI